MPAHDSEASRGRREGSEPVKFEKIWRYKVPMVIKAVPGEDRDQHALRERMKRTDAVTPIKASSEKAPAQPREEADDATCSVAKKTTGPDLACDTAECPTTPKRQRAESENIFGSLLGKLKFSSEKKGNRRGTTPKSRVSSPRQRVSAETSLRAPMGRRSAHETPTDPNPMPELLNVDKSKEPLRKLLGDRKREVAQKVKPLSKALIPGTHYDRFSFDVDPIPLFEHQVVMPEKAAAAKKPPVVKKMELGQQKISFFESSLEALSAEDLEIMRRRFPAQD